MDRKLFEECGYSKVLGEDGISTFEAVYNDELYVAAVINPNTKEPYFIVIKNYNDYEKPIYISRISMTSPRYIQTENEDYILSPDEVNTLTKILTSKDIAIFPVVPSDCYPIKYRFHIDKFERRLRNAEISVWEAIIFKYNELLIPEDYPNWEYFNEDDNHMPDYNKLKEYYN